MARIIETRLGALLTVVTVCCAFASPSHAYLDPGTGSIILQSVLASIAVAFGVLRLYWHRLKAFVSTLIGGASKPETSQEQRFEQGADVENEP